MPFLYSDQIVYPLKPRSEDMRLVVEAELKDRNETFFSWLSKLNDLAFAKIAAHEYSRFSKRLSVTPFFALSSQAYADDAAPDTTFVLKP